MKKNFHLFLGAILLSTNVLAQDKIKDGTISSSNLPNSGALLDLESNNRALLLTRVSLSATTTWGLNGSAPTQGGYTVYNTNASITGNTAYPIITGGIGVYYWDGTGWVATKNASTYVEPWYNQANNQMATTNTQNIYQMGKVAIGRNTTYDAATLHVQGAIRGGNDPQGTVGLHSIGVGSRITASGNYSTAFGDSTSATGDRSTAFGNRSVASGANSIAIGYQSEARGTRGVALGYQTVAGVNGTNALAMGNQTRATGNNSTAMGYSTTASGDNSTAMGYSTSAIGDRSTALGNESVARGANSFAMGYNASARGTRGIAFGYNTISALDATDAQAFGSNTTASGNNSTAFGISSTASGNNSTAFGNSSIASGVNSTAFGFDTRANNDRSTAFGHTTIASGESSTAFGALSRATAMRATAFGYNTRANGASSTAFGNESIANGSNSTAFGNSATTGSEATNAISMGNSTTANHANALVAGNNVTSNADNQFTARFQGGYRFMTQAQATGNIGAQLINSANAWSTMSSKALKENFQPVDGKQVLSKIVNFNLTSWNYIGQDKTKLRHYGPMAEDFYEAFGWDGVGKIGVDDSINQADFDGINLIAIQALAQENIELKARIERLEKMILERK
jgi:hypothetical protein